jgi:ParB-like chromosome segregation protein Spo0J
VFIRDRIKELRRVRAGDLRPNPRNWRTHSDEQQDALRGILAEVGYADALLTRELPDGSLELIDGHLRAETTPDAEVPVLVLDVDEAEALKLLAVLDPLAGMAGRDQKMLVDIVQMVETDNQALRAMLDKMAEMDEPDLDLGQADELPRAVHVPEAYQVVVECADESEQQALYQQLSGEGYKCRVLVL